MTKRQAFSPTTNSPQGKCQMAIIPGRAAHLTGDCDTKPSIGSGQGGLPEEVTVMLGAGGGKEPALGKLVSRLVPG